MKKGLMVSSVLLGTLAIAGCNKSSQQQTIELPAGQLHVSTQWVDGQLWVESFDPKSHTCFFSEYKDGRAVESKTITLNNCRTGLGGPMIRPAMERRMMMEQGGMMRPNMPPRPGRVQPPRAMQQPAPPAAGGQPQPVPQAAPAPTAPPVAPPAQG